MVLSPITQQPAKLIEPISSSFIIGQYRKEMDVDVADYFENIPEIYLYECEQTGYRFFYPFNLDGDAAFYEQLQKYPWYYADWKWDYDAALPYVDAKSKVLDIGCGYGNFLINLKEKKQCDCTGLEFNDKAVKTGRDKGLKISKETIQEHAKTHRETYNTVCYFQVLEHIADVDAFIQASIQTLKKGGKLIICVPNNNPFWLQYDKYHSMNMPPHHMGWWNKAVFERLTKIYPIQLQAIKEEELSRFRFFTKLYINNRAGSNRAKKGLYKLFTPFFIAYFLINRKNVKAGNILAIYTKK